MGAYNTTLRQFRNEKNLTLKKASKEIGISRLRLFLFENGYFKPRGKTLDKIEKYYDKKIDLTDENSYPVPFNKKQNVLYIFYKQKWLSQSSLLYLNRIQ